MAKKRRKGGRFTPKGTRPPHLRVVGDEPPRHDPLYELITSGGRELIEHDDPVDAESWASMLVGTFDAARLQASLEGTEAPPFEDEILAHCLDLGDARAALVAAAFSSVVGPPFHAAARTTASALRHAPGTPRWIDAIGQVEATAAWVASDVFGDQDSLVIGFHQRGQAVDHALIALVDHNLSGQAKDLWLAPALEEVVDSWSSSDEPHLSISSVPVQEALARLRDAMAVADVWNGDAELRSEEFAQYRALAWSRMRRAGLGDGPPDSTEISQRARDALVVGFMSSPYGAAAVEAHGRGDVEILAHHLVDLRADYEGQPLRWSPIVVSSILYDLAPRKLLLEHDQVAALPAVMAQWVRFSAGRTGLEDRFVEEILSVVDDQAAEYLERMADQTLAGPGKAVLATLKARGVDITDFDALNEALEAGPIRLPRPLTDMKPRIATAPPGLAETVGSTPVLARFSALAEFYEEGRKITQTGRPTLADARALVGVLGTRDRLDETIGDRTFKTRSAGELPELSFTLRWAEAAGVLERGRTRMQTAPTWIDLGGQPLEQWFLAVDALAPLGPLATYHEGSRYRSGDEVLDDLAGELLHLLVDGSIPFEHALDWVCQRAEEDWEWSTPFADEHGYRRMSLGWDLGRLAEILGWAGVMSRPGSTLEEDRLGYTRRIGGELALTRAGRWYLTGAV